MDFEHDNVRTVVNEDRLSSLPDELIHKILSYTDTKFAVQTSSLSSRWKLIWTSMPYLNFYSWYFNSLPKFSKFVTHVLSRRNHQTEVLLVKLNFEGAASQVFVRKIANYAFSHNVQELTIFSFPKKNHELPLCLFSSQSLERFTLRTRFLAPCITPKIPWDFPALTTLHLSEITLCDETTKSIDLFSKCVNLRDLTLKHFFINGVEVFDIITPKLANLTLIDGRRCPKVVNLSAPQLVNLTIEYCSIKYMSAPPGLSSLFYKDYCPLQLSKNGFHSLDKVTLHLSMYSSYKPYEEQDASKTINMLQELNSAKFLTLNTDIVECLSSFPDLLSIQPAPFNNLKRLNIEPSQRKDAYKIKMSTQVKNFLLENSPSATFIMELPEAPLTKSMKQKEARAKKKAKQEAELESIMAELQALLKQGRMHNETEVAEKKAKLKADLLVLQICETESGEIERGKAQIDSESEKAQVRPVVAWIKGLTDEMRLQSDEADAEVRAVLSKKIQFEMSLEILSKRQRAQMEARYSQQLKETKAWCEHLVAQTVVCKTISELLSDYILTFPDVDCGQLPSASQPSPSSSSLGIIPASSSTTATPMQLSALWRFVCTLLDKYF